MPDATPSSRKPAAPSPWWSHKLLLAAIAITLVGAGLWIYAATTRPHAPPASQTTHSTPSGLAQGLAPTTPQATTPAPTVEPRLIDELSPAVTRFGGAFIVGFCVAYAFKKVIKISAIVVGVILIAMFGMQRAGIIDMDWPTIQTHLERSVAWVQGEAGAMKEFILGYLPATGSTLAGMFFGLRKG